MTIGSIHFLLCAVACTAGALITVFSRNPIRGALGLLLTIVGIAGMYLKLHAQFLAAIQLIVYAGAVVVLFVFVLMLLGQDATDQNTSRRSSVARIAGGTGLVAVFMIAAIRAIHVYSPATHGRFPSLREDFGSVSSVGAQLFSDALVPFELSTALLIVAVIGAIAVARSGRSKRPIGRARVSSAHEYFAGPIRPRDAGHPISKEPTL